ncbi:MAG: ABC transporter permease subunit [Alphaproteobacteria bacterium]|jgi:putrescine transport system permease protein|uniref:ABC transporter permease subunit n=1 Tax=Devosia sp. XGJD_8 TaxID=3391187 RepID=UPI001DD84BC4|nr:ABC transporter permease subunit [Alphaproteobacteria bacterium]MBU1561569.1 ABC transporter permease subunit [Alphaproteobacteria bacterium]MBU2303058.1 ABC transporter permease subunit [Alphaproteobacteria bacterium]MBU2366475.1 ABC transporter permease subunit [Alphaproteobacteria bacterium]
MSSYDIDSPPPRRRAWTGVERALAAVGLSGKALVIAAPAIWLTVFFLVPLAVVFGISLTLKQFGRPPYTPLLTTEEGTVQLTLHLNNYIRLFTDSLYVAAYLNSIKIALISTIIALLIGYPMAYAIARAPERWRNILLMLVILPFWTSFLLRVYALTGFMRGNGVINQVLAVFGIEPLVMMQTDFAVYVGIVYTYLPFMILPLYTNLVKLDGALLEASADLGARPARTFLSITLPLSMPGIIAGSMLVFIPAIGEFVIPSLLGGPSTLMIGRVLWDEFFANTNWPRAAAVAIAMLVAVVVPVMLLQKAQDAVQDSGRTR